MGSTMAHRFEYVSSEAVVLSTIFLSRRRGMICHCPSHFVYLGLVLDLFGVDLLLLVAVAKYDFLLECLVRCSRISDFFGSLWIC